MGAQEYEYYTQELRPLAATLAVSIYTRVCVCVRVRASVHLYRV